MFELEKFGIFLGKKKKPALHRDKFALVDGIKFGQTRTVRATNDEALFTISLGKPLPAIEGGINPDLIFRLLVAYFPDGTVKELVVDFSGPYLPWQYEDETDRAAGSEPHKV